MKHKLVKAILQDNIIIGKTQLFSLPYYTNEICGKAFFSYYALNKNKFVPFVYSAHDKRILSIELKVLEKTSFLTNNTIILTHSTLENILKNWEWKSLNDFKINTKIKLLTRIKLKTNLNFIEYKDLFFKHINENGISVTLPTSTYLSYKDNFDFLDYKMIYKSLFE